MATRFATLSANVVADTAQWSTGLRKAANDVGRFQSKSNRAFRGVNRSIARTGKRFGSFAKSGLSLRSVVGLLAGGGGLGLLTKRAIDAGDSIAKTADKIGIGTEALQEYRIAADLAGVSNESLDKGFETFSRRIAEAISGVGQFKLIAAEYKIELEDANGAQRSFNAILADVISTVRNASTQQEKLNIVYGATGRSAIGLTKLFEQGNEAINEQIRGFRKAGLILSDDFARGAERAKDELTLANTALSVSTNRLSILFAPALVFAAEKAAAFVGVLELVVDALADVDSASSTELRSRRIFASDALLEARERVLRAELELNDARESGNAILRGVATAALALANANVRAQESLVAELEKELETRKTIAKVPPGGATGAAAAQSFTFPGGAVLTPFTPTELPKGLEPTAALGLPLQGQGGLSGGLGAGAADPFVDAANNITATRQPIADLRTGLADARTEADALHDTVGLLEPAFVQAAGAFGNALVGLFSSTKSFKEQLLDLGRQLSSIGAQTFITGALQSGASSFFGGGAGGFGGFRHEGGPVAPGQSFIVRPDEEVFVPKTAGVVVPISRQTAGGAGGGSGLTLIQNIQSERVDDFRASVTQLAADAQRINARESARVA